ncbi:hypothetical protein ACJIZ3_001286 [Penstemon smallii]|uniref:Uncharacterized protein n=1 Tax=Penstemon smallii TaxID=265156 RepID=A0ABD3U5W7_9LAMI
MKIKKELLVIKTERHELRKKFFWLKRQRIFGAQYEIIFSCKTRLDKEPISAARHLSFSNPRNLGELGCAQSPHD